MSTSLERLGWEPFFARQVPPGTADRVARVSGARGEAVEVLHPGGRELAWLTPATLGARTGDWVLVRDGDPPRVVRVLERRTTLERLAPSGGRSQVMAANVDAAFLVAAADAPLRPGRLARLAVVALAAGLELGVVLNKVDRPARRVRRAEAELRRLFPGLEPLRTSATTGEGVEALRAATRGRTVVLLGPSGAGKSSLANRLLGEEVLEVGAVRARDRKGRHTTTRRTLLPIPGGGLLIDTPGLRAVGLPGGGGLDAAFPEVAEAAAACRWTDCTHAEGEQGCAVREALAAGRIDPLRFRLYEVIAADLAGQPPRASTRTP